MYFTKHELNFLFPFKTGSQYIVQAGLDFEMYHQTDLQFLIFLP
jgi:hypothetical protein